MSFLSPLAGAAGAAAALPSPGHLLPSQVALFASPLTTAGRGPIAVREGRLSLERLLDEATQSQNSSQAEALDVFVQARAGLAKASSAKQLDAFANLPTGQPRSAPDAEAAQLEAEGGLMAKLQEQLMPWLKQQVQEMLAGGKGVLDLDVNAKLQAALCQEDIMTRAASSIAEALPTVLAKQIRDSQEMSMAGSICAPKTEQQRAQLDLTTTKMTSTSAAGSDSSSGREDEAEQQATSALKPGNPARANSAGEVKGPASEQQDEEDQDDDAVERPTKRACYSAEDAGAQLTPAPSAAETLFLAAPQLHPAAPLAEPAPSSGITASLGAVSLGCAAGAPATGGGGRKRRTNYVKMRELEASIQEARVVEQHLQHAVRGAELQHAAILEENRQLWNAVAHINATLHAGRASMLAAVLQQAPPSPTRAVAAPHEPAHPAGAGAGLGGVGMSPDLHNIFGSPDPMCLAEACGMLFSPAPAKLASKPLNKPRKLFEDELGGCGGGKGVPAAAEGAEPGRLPLLDDMPNMPKLEFAH